MKPERFDLDGTYAPVEHLEEVSLLKAAIEQTWPRLTDTLEFGDFIYLNVSNGEHSGINLGGVKRANMTSLDYAPDVFEYTADMTHEMFSSMAILRLANSLLRDLLAPASPMDALMQLLTSGVGKDESAPVLS